MSDTLDLEGLTTKEISALYGKTRQEALKRRGTEQVQNQVRQDLGVGDGGYWKDSFGYVHDGERPKPKQDRYYISAEGYAIELADGEQPPISQGATLLDKVTNFVNQNCEDKDVKKLLPKDLSVFEEQSADFPQYTLIGTLGRGKWRVTALNQTNDSQSFKFTLASDFDCESAIAAAMRYLENRVGPKFRELSEADRNLIQRKAVVDKNEALLFYLRARLPLPWAQELERLIAQSELTGNTSTILEYVSQPKIHATLEEAIEACWAWNRPHIEITEEMREFFRQRTQGIALTYPLLDSLLKHFQTGRAVSQLGSEPAAPSLEDLNSLTDAEVEDLHQRTRIELARARR